MRLKGYQIGELVGIAFLLASTATQLFYVEPLKREIEWRLAAFNNQQQAQIQLKALYDNQVTLLQQLNAPVDRIAETEQRRDKILGAYKNSDADIADFMIEKERVEGYLQVVVIALFAIGSILAGIGRVLEMQTARRAAESEA